MSFAQKVVIVTGAGSGIGAATATLFAREGALVSIVDVNAAGLKAVAEKIMKFGNKPLLITADVSKDDDAKRIIYETVKTFSRLDVLVNNAGIWVQGKILDGKVLQSYDAIMGVNLRAVVHLTMLAAPHLVATKGNIVNLSSMGAVTVPEDFLAYCVSKAGVAHFTRGAALELAASGVRVNSVAPGPTATNILKGSGKTFEDFANQTPLKRYSKPEEIGELILFLADAEKAKGITGVDYVLDNGALLASFK